MTKATKPNDPIDDYVEQVENASQSAADRVKAGAKDIGDSVRRTADDAAKSVSDAADRAASTLRGAADALRDGTFQERTFGQLAASLADAADAVRNKDLSELSTEAAAFAKRNPAVFIGGAAILGFAVARMMTTRERA
ncbi:MAG: hypothetical protein KDK26_03815 [Roseivivax sp.]|nr:hypothetical protein [Roseivivax sp.]